MRNEYIYDWNHELIFILDQTIEEKIWEMKEKKKNDDEYISGNESSDWENQSIER